MRRELRIGAALAAALGASALARSAAAQATPTGGEVGYPPPQSPFRDLQYSQSFTLIGGYFRAAKDPAGVAPQSGPLFGLQYDLGGGPAVFTTRVRSVISDRTVLDPARPANARVIGTERRPLTMVDAGLSLALTGARTYRGFVPLVHVGAGLVTNFGKADLGGFEFGTSFALAYGLGLRYVPSPASRYALRADLGNAFYRVRYPARYALPSTGYDPRTYGSGPVDSSSIVPANSALSRYRNNTALTVGVSYLFHR